MSDEPFNDADIALLKERLEIGDPLKDFYDEVELIRRLVATVDQAAEERTFLSALEAAGVDNWDGFEEAKEIQRGWQAEAAAKGGATS